jgi:hypothetical protein
MDDFDNKCANFDGKSAISDGKREKSCQKRTNFDKNGQFPIAKMGKNRSKSSIFHQKSKKSHKLASIHGLKFLSFTPAKSKKIKQKS